MVTGRESLIEVWSWEEPRVERKRSSAIVSKGDFTRTRFVGWLSCIWNDRRQPTAAWGALEARMRDIRMACNWKEHGRSMSYSNRVDHQRSNCWRFSWKDAVRRKGFWMSSCVVVTGVKRVQFPIATACKSVVYRQRSPLSTMVRRRCPAKRNRIRGTLTAGQRWQRILTEFGRCPFQLTVAGQRKTDRLIVFGHQRVYAERTRSLRVCHLTHLCVQSRWLQIYQQNGCSLVRSFLNQNNAWRCLFLFRNVRFQLYRKRYLRPQIRIIDLRKRKTKR